MGQLKVGGEREREEGEVLVLRLFYIISIYLYVGCGLKGYESHDHDNM